MSRTLTRMRRAFGLTVDPIGIPMPGTPGSARAGMTDYVTKPTEVYQRLMAYYRNTGLYDQINRMWDTALQRKVDPLRNPAHQIVETYVDMVWPGTTREALQIIPLARENEIQSGELELSSAELGDNYEIIPYIQQMWDWSNWDTIKSVDVRWNAIYGNSFTRIVVDPPGGRHPTGRVWYQMIDPNYVPDFDIDARDYLTYLRIDTPTIIYDEAGIGRLRYFVEIWDRNADSYRTFIADSPDAPYDVLLQNQRLNVSLSTTYGIDFIPVAHCKFFNTGEPFGAGAYLHGLTLIDEANRMATRYHEMLYRYNKVIWLITSKDDSIDLGVISGAFKTETTDENNPYDPYTITIGGEQFLNVPGAGAELTANVPNVNFDAMRSEIGEHMQFMEDTMPAMKYRRLMEQGQLTGRAAEVVLGPVVTGVREARGNMNRKMIRLHEMGLTLGIIWGVFPASLGDYYQRDFNHAIVRQPVIPISDLEIATELSMQSDAALKMLQVGFSRGEVLRRIWSMTDAQIEAMADEREKETIEQAPPLLTTRSSMTEQRETNRNDPSEAQLPRRTEGRAAEVS